MITLFSQVNSTIKSSLVSAFRGHNIMRNSESKRNLDTIPALRSHSSKGRKDIHVRNTLSLSIISTGQT